MSKSSILFFGGGGERKASSETTILRCVFAASFAQPFSSLGGFVCVTIDISLDDHSLNSFTCGVLS